MSFSLRGWTWSQQNAPQIDDIRWVCSGGNTNAGESGRDTVVGVETRVRVRFLKERSRYSGLLRLGLELLPLQPLSNLLPRPNLGGLGVGEMNKFNLPRRNIQKERRAKRAEKRKRRSSAATLRVSSGKALASISGKKARKLQKRWRQVGFGHTGIRVRTSGIDHIIFRHVKAKAQKEALQSGLVTMHDIEMMAIDEEGGGNQGSLQPKLPELRRAFLMKKRAKLRLKSSSSKGVSRKTSRR
uniref:Uncharacterized protein n=1 Tax=Physcomitrium patens TaxID=3218 RepID=A0A7I4AP88_PHYPA|nr:uncharacterized protein LOC112290483 isoform X2 [Physcomitrium patens]|eukprot:XP_024392530.1 uncharacterized protein LOC112290483 isoform X2 [Physcomitrella patens]